MVIRIQCPVCNGLLSAPSISGGANLFCTGCGSQVLVPAPRVSPETEAIFDRSKVSSDRVRARRFIHFPCPGCGKRRKATPSCMGKVVRCSCGQRIQVPTDLAAGCLPKLQSEQEEPIRDLVMDENSASMFTGDLNRAKLSQVSRVQTNAPSFAGIVFVAGTMFGLAITVAWVTSLLCWP
jgi:hypothetical protein